MGNGVSQALWLESFQFLLPAAGNWLWAVMHNIITYSTTKTCLRMVRNASTVHLQLSGFFVVTLECWLNSAKWMTWWGAATQRACDWARLVSVSQTVWWRLSSRTFSRVGVKSLCSSEDVRYNGDDRGRALRASCLQRDDGNANNSDQWNKVKINSK